MKKNVLLSVIGVLLVLGIGVSFAYFVSQTLVSGDGASVTAEPGDMIKVTYDAGDGIINSSGMVPGDIAIKKFSVTVTPTETEKEATYSIILNITENTFVKCDDSNYNSLTNACEKDVEELIYRLKDNDNQVIAEGSLMEVTGEIKLITETKTVDVETTYNYTLEIEFIETGYDQNHNQNKAFNGSVEVEFDEVIPANEYILSHYDTVLTRDDFSINITDTTTGTIYKSLDESQYDNDGEVYYFAGNPTDNWVKFGGFYWRIIRINGNGSIRLIFNGTSTSPVGEITQIGSDYYSSGDDNEYVGYMYELGQVHGTSSSSILKQRLDSWYESNLANYIKYIDTSTGFCNDRMPYTDNKGTTSGGGIGLTYTWYAAFIRLYSGMSSSNASPSFKCTNINDLFTVNNSSKGNKVLNYPIGTITADEVAYAGGVFDKDNTSYYLYNELGYWTMSPWLKSSTGYACIFAVYSTGRMMNGRTRLDTYGVRPVINLRAAVQLTGSGTTDDPYVVVGAE